MIKIKYCGKKKKDIVINPSLQNGLQNKVSFLMESGHIAEVSDADARILLKDEIFKSVTEDGSVVTTIFQSDNSPGTPGLIVGPGQAAEPIESDAGMDGVEENAVIKTKDELVGDYVASLARKEKIDIIAFVSGDPLFNGFKVDTRRGKDRLLNNIRDYLMEKKELGV